MAAPSDGRLRTTSLGGFLSAGRHVIVTQPHGVDAVVGKGLAQAGDRSARAAAFVRLSEEHLDASYRLAHAILGNRAEAEDATHDALIQAWRHWSQLRDQARFAQWFDRILVNTCRNRLRHAKKFQIQDLSPELAIAGRDAIGNADDRDQIRAGLAALSPDHRLVVALRYYADLPVEGIAARLGIPVGTVNSRLHYALQHLRAALDETSPQEQTDDRPRARAAPARLVSRRGGLLRARAG